MLHKVHIAIPNHSYDVVIGPGAMMSDSLDAFVKDNRQIAIVSNVTVDALYGDALAQRLESQTKNILRIQLPDGEAYKHWETLNLIFDALLEHRFDRRCLLIALGGGVVGDITGFAAASYQRGVDFIQIPTTLLSQVDSSVGGKTGINHPAGKNMIGAFYQPKLVLADTAVLSSLPGRELSAGLAEVIKHGAIADLDYLNLVEKNMAALRQCDGALLAKVVERSVQIKAAVVMADEREAGLRATLNFGHTFGHAIEAGLGYGEWLHGEAVGAGMVMAANLSQRLGLISEQESIRIEAVVSAAGLPTRGPAWAASRYVQLMQVDKKAQSGVPKFILLNSNTNKSSPSRATIQKVDESIVCDTLRACGAVN